MTTFDLTSCIELFSQLKRRCQKLSRLLLAVDWWQLSVCAAILGHQCNVQHAEPSPSPTPCCVWPGPSMAVLIPIRAIPLCIVRQATVCHRTERFQSTTGIRAWPSFVLHFHNSDRLSRIRLQYCLSSIHRRSAVIHIHKYHVNFKQFPCIV